MVENTQGLVLRTRPLTETSLIVHWLTPGLGRIATVAKGARRPQSPFRGKVDLFYLVDLSFSRSRRSDLHTLREVMLRETHSALRRGLACLRQASYAAALVEQTTETETPLPAVFQLMTGLLAHLPAQPAQPITLFALEMKLLVELGLRPELKKNTLSPGARQVLARIADLDWASVARLKPSAAQTREIQQFLHGFLVYHLGKVPAGRDAALAATV
jgi:DNA repair protein RecO (recombination protein O)